MTGAQMYPLAMMLGAQQRAMMRTFYSRAISLFRVGDPICVAFDARRALMLAGVPTSTLGRVISVRPSRKPGSRKWRIEVEAREMNGTRHGGVVWADGSWKAKTPQRLNVRRPRSALEMM